MNNTDKPLPSDPLVESQVLGALMIDEDGSGWDGEAATLNIHHFYSIKNQRIFAAIASLREDNKVPDLISVMSRMRDQQDNEIVDDGYLTQIATSIPTRAMLGQHVGILSEKKRLRELAELGSRIYDKAVSLDDSISILSTSMSQIEEIGRDGNAAENQTPEALSQLLTECQNRMAGKDVTGIPTGIADIDRVIGGLQPSIYNVLMGQPSSGKTSFADQAVINAIMRGESVLYIGLEGSLRGVLGKMAAKMADLSYSGYSKARFTESQYRQFMDAAKKIASKKLFLIRPNQLASDNLRTTIRQMWRSHGITLVVIDYLQKIFQGSNPDRERTEIAAASKQFHSALIECNIAGLALAQLNREGEKAERPCLYHLKGSGQIGQDADTLIALWCKEKRETWDPYTPLPVIATVLKQKNDRLGDIPLLFDRCNMRFTCPERQANSKIYE